MADNELDRATAWDELGKELAEVRLKEQQWAIRDALIEILYAIQDGEQPTVDEIAEARQALDHARGFLENKIVPITDGAEPWDSGVSDVAPYPAMRAQLEQTDSAPSITHRSGGFK